MKQAHNAVAWAALIASGAALAGTYGTHKPLPASQEIPEAGLKRAHEFSAAFNAVAEFVKPSVVQINIEKKVAANGGMRRGRPGGGRPGPGQGQPDGDVQQVDPKQMEEMLRRFFGGNGPPQGFRMEPQQFAAAGTGSGFIIDAKGHILTNNHVVEGADKIVVSFHDGVEAPAEIVGTYPEADVAVIKVENTEYPAVPLGSSRDLKVGDWVLAFGSPFGLSQTVTSGIISATQRENVDINRFESFLQTDAAINQGNSGGPLVDLHGKVVGINSAIATQSGASAGVGFAIPIDMASRLAAKLIKNGKIEPALMGVIIEPLNRALARNLGVDAKTQGVVVLEVGDDTPASKAGLKVGDVITAFDGQPVTSRKALQYLVSTSDIGQAYDLTFVRGGQTQTVPVTPVRAQLVANAMDRGEPAGPEPRVRRQEEPALGAPAAEADAFGLAVSPLDPALAKRFGWSADQGGLVVTKVKPDSPAEAAGIEVGDLITKLVKNKAIVANPSVAEFQGLTDVVDELAVYVEDVRKRLPGEFKTLTRPDAGK